MKRLFVSLPLLSFPFLLSGLGAADSAPPKSLADRIAETWNGSVEVFAREQDTSTPQGYRIVSDPSSAGKVLKRITKASTIGVKAILTTEEGQTFYVSGWSWENASGGKIPTWIKPEGTVPALPSEPSSSSSSSASASAEPPTTAPAPAASAKSDPGIRPTDADRPGRVVAILAGNGRYSAANPAQSQLDLPSVSHDIALLAGVLVSLGAEVHTVEDGNRSRILETIASVATGLEANDAVLVYYTGHAVQIAGKNHLAPAGISFLDKDQVKATGVALDEILAAFASRPHRVTSVVLDAARNNPFNSVDASTHLSRLLSTLRSAATAQSTSGLAEVKPVARTVVAFSTAPGAIIAPASSEASSGPSAFAKAFARALAQDTEIREMLAKTSQWTREETRGAQSPWVSAPATPFFYPHLPSRKIAGPDDDALVATHWLSSDLEQGFPLALARLARSVRQRPTDNPSAAALFYLLSYQAVPVPLKSWGPYKLKDSEFDPGLKSSIDGTFVGLFPKGSSSPSLILNRMDGSVVSGINDSFAPSEESAQVVAKETEHLVSGDGQPVSAWCIHRAAWDGGLKDAPVADPRATAPILKRGKLVASYYDEGLERVYLATLETTKGAAGMFLSEYAVTPPIDSLPALLRQRPSRRVPAAGPAGGAPMPLASAADGAWSLVLDASGAVSLCDRAGTPRYRRTDGVLDDWLVSDRGASVLLLYRDQFELLSLEGESLGTIPTPWPVDHRGSLLGFSLSFRRIFAAHQPESESSRLAPSRIVAIDTARGSVMRPETEVAGYTDFAAVSSDGEWFFFYDQGRRLRMWDSATAGARLDLPSTRVPAPLPVPGMVCESDPLQVPTFQASNPPLIGNLAGSYSAPLWLPDLAESLAGFRITEGGTLEWIPNATQKLRDTAKAMNKQARDTTSGEWAVWFLTHRLRAVAP